MMTHKTTISRRAQVTRGIRNARDHGRRIYKSRYITHLFISGLPGNQASSSTGVLRSRCKSCNLPFLSETTGTRRTVSISQITQESKSRTRGMQRHYIYGRRGSLGTSRSNVDRGETDAGAHVYLQRRRPVLCPINSRQSAGKK